MRCAEKAEGLAERGVGANLIGMSVPSTIFELLHAGAGGDLALMAPERPAATCDGLRAHVERTVAGLRERGLGRGDRVAIVLPGGPEAAGAFLSVAAGAVAAPLNPAYTENEFAFCMADLRAKAVLVTEGSDSPARSAAASLGMDVLEMRVRSDDPAGTFGLAGATDEAAERRGGAAQPRPNDTALLLHTSGTTSRPKLVALLQRNVCASALHVRDSLALAPGDRCLNVMPLFHVHGLVACVLASLAAGASVYCAPGFNALKFFRWMDDCVPTWYSAAPAIHQAVLARAGRNPEAVARARLRFVRSSSAPLPLPVARRIEETFAAPVVESYAMTEAAHQMTSAPLPPALRKPGTVGPAAGPRMSVVDEAGAHLGPGETGEIVVRGPNVTPGYENNPAANQAAFADGWFRTGDQGFRDEDGYFTVTGRIKEIINRGGEKVSPQEVDDVLVEHPAVAQAATFALPHPTLGEEVAAAVVLQERGSGLDAARVADAATVASVRAFAAQRLAAFKAPRKLFVVDQLPKGPSGKLRRTGLAEQLELAASRRTGARQEPGNGPDRSR